MGLATFFGFEAEYLGGILLILFAWILVKGTLPKDLEEEARENAREEIEGEERILTTGKLS